MSTAILDIPEVRKRVQRWSVEQYEHLVEQGELAKNNELIRGLIIEKMSKSPLHGSIAKRLYDSFLRRIPSGFSVRQDLPLSLADSSPEPDIAIALGTDRDFDKRHPNTAALVIEVAVSSVALDRENASLYAEASVDEYWIVIPRTRKVEVYRFPEVGVYREVQTVSEGRLECVSITGVSVDLADLFG